MSEVSEMGKRTSELLFVIDPDEFDESFVSKIIEIKKAPEITHTYPERQKDIDSFVDRIDHVEVERVKEDTRTYVVIPARHRKKIYWPITFSFRSRHNSEVTLWQYDPLREYERTLYIDPYEVMNNTSYRGLRKYALKEWGFRREVTEEEIVKYD